MTIFAFETRSRNTPIVSSYRVKAVLSPLRYYHDSRLPDGSPRIDLLLGRRSLDESRVHEIESTFGSKAQRCA